MKLSKTQQKEQNAEQKWKKARWKESKIIIIKKQDWIPRKTIS